MGTSLRTYIGGLLINQEDFARFLRWLHPNQELAAERYERIRRRLITISAARGVSDPEEMADECIDRVVRKVPEIAVTHTVEPEVYFYSVFKFVLLEWRKKKQPVELLDPEEFPDPSEDSSVVEKQHVCLGRCLTRLDDASRELVLEYYRHDGRAKIDHRRALAQRLGITVNALRVRALRIRQPLEQCVQQCTDEDE